MPRCNPSFLFGLPRSGTTLLSVMLNNHPDIYCPPEPWIMFALESIGRTHPAHPAGAGLIGTAFQAFLPPRQRMKALRVFARSLYQEKLKSVGKTTIIDKTPRYYSIIPFLKELFPSGNTIVAIRDPFDIAASYKNSWGVDLAADIRQHNDTPHAADFVLGIEELTKLIAATNKHTHVTHYESLVENPISELSSLLAFLKLPACEGMEHFSLKGSEYHSHYLGDRNVLQTTAPHKKSIGSWKKTFQPQELGILLNAVGSETLDRLGYHDTLQELRRAGVLDKGPEYCDFVRNVYKLRKDTRQLAMAGDCLYEANPPKP